MYGLLRTLIFFAIWGTGALAAAIAYWQGDLGWWSLLAGILGAALTAKGAELAIHHGPLCLQRPFYKKWKQQVTDHIASCGDNLFAYPTLAWLELQADGIFEQRGLLDVQQAAKDYIDGLHDRLHGLITNMQERS